MAGNEGKRTRKILFILIPIIAILVIAGAVISIISIKIKNHGTNPINKKTEEIIDADKKDDSNNEGEAVDSVESVDPVPPSDDKGVLHCTNNGLVADYDN